MINMRRIKSLITGLFRAPPYRDLNGLQYPITTQYNSVK